MSSMATDEVPLRATRFPRPALAAIVAVCAGSSTVPALTMAIETATGRTARIAALSESGRVYCFERTANGSIRYGSARGIYGAVDPSVFERAIAHCGSTPWGGAAVRMLDMETMCDGWIPRAAT
ncbi:MAG: hypothetical protein ACXVEI_08260 [Actinomycetota bacterium]